MAGFTFSRVRVYEEVSLSLSRCLIMRIVSSATGMEMVLIFLTASLHTSAHRQACNADMRTLTHARATGARAGPHGGESENERICSSSLITRLYTGDRVESHRQRERERERLCGATISYDSRRISVAAAAAAEAAAVK